MRLRGVTEGRMSVHRVTRRRLFPTPRGLAGRRVRGRKRTVPARRSFGWIGVCLCVTPARVIRTVGTFGSAGRSWRGRPLRTVSRRGTAAIKGMRT